MRRADLLRSSGTSRIHDSGFSTLACVDGALIAPLAHSEDRMRYIVAWILGVPFSVIVLWYLVGHAACGR
jgi:hypothetical protein